MKMLECCWMTILGMLVVLVMTACNANEGSKDAGFLDADGKQDGGDQTIPYSCPFPFAPPETHILYDDMGVEVRAFDLQLLCTLEYENNYSEIFLLAVPTEIVSWDTFYTAKEAYVCRDEQVDRLTEGEFYYRSYHHGWDEMGVSIEGLKYTFGWSEICVGFRPCTSSFDVFDVRQLDDTLVEEKLPTSCVHLSIDGYPLPLVPQVRVPTQGDQITFPMGSNNGDPDEQPVHDVFLRPMRIDVREATNSDFALFLNDHGNDCNGYPCLTSNGDGLMLHQEGTIWKPQHGHEKHPVVHVTWYGAEAYCQWRSMQVPTEALWEMAASGGGAWSYPWNNQPPTCDLALFAACGLTSPQATCSYTLGQSREGVCDLSGNVAEWVSDWYQEDFYSSCTQSCNSPTGPETATGRKVIRGGSFADPAAELRATNRSSAEPAFSSNCLGTRCVRRTFPQNP